MLARIRSLPFPLCAPALLCVPAAAQVAAPSQLHGKSVGVKWSEDREQKVSGFDHSEFVRIGMELHIDVSSAGRVFNRFSASRHGRGNRVVGTYAGASDQIAGDQNSRQVDFERNALHGDAGFESGARRVSVKFDQGYAGCNADAITGKAEGAKSTIFTSVVSGHRVEVRSAKTNSPSRQVVNGNVFGN